MLNDSIKQTLTGQVIMFGRLKSWSSMWPKLWVVRIAFSTTFGILCLLMIAWWVRSYWWADSVWLRVPPSEHVHVRAGDGRMIIYFDSRPSKKWFSWHSERNISPDADNRIPWLDVGLWPQFVRVYTAHWLLTVIAASLAVMPWCPRRFGLRGMLIAITVVAATAATIAWVDRAF